MMDIRTELDHYAYVSGSESNSRVKGLFNGGRRGTMIPTSLASLMFTVASCSTARPAVATEAHVSHLIAEEITLVDTDGKPWLRIGPRDDTGLQGLQIFSEIGEPALMLGILQAEVPNAATQADQAFTSGSETELIPAIGLYSPNGERRRSASTSRSRFRSLAHLESF